eukprot:gnl/MRDRNA2_/MRDRNA2_124620_c0_seq1.p1 gnl/MRDRNA2_/MRDRNA2_124620_c0~~gnl/MRDRNA2_/MRDRNA2_124620_c0_seq1.p1  ORF type:complete len:348 (-),score=43.90 gnl/MRDRNA2_/MRDRNA2_124620_c0_seq1:87-1130(-)
MTDASDDVALAHKLLDHAKAGHWKLVAQIVNSSDGRKVINSMPSGRWGAIHQAAFWGHKDAVKMLLQAGADPQMRNRNGDTALQVALSKKNSSQGYVDVVNLLRKSFKKQSNHVEVMALAMATHPRLGSASPAKILTSEIFMKVGEFLREAEQPAFQCPDCHWRLGGFVCRGSRASSLQVEIRYDASGWPMPITTSLPGVTIPVATSGCGMALVAHDNKLRCPKGCGEATLFCHSHGQMKFDPGHVVPAGADIMVGTKSEAPLLTCDRCGWSVDGALCLTEGHEGEPLPLERNGFFERVACSYVWTCRHGCSRKQHGGTYADGALQCTCGGSMLALEYTEIHGPPMN